jgi:tRNA 2-thiouridine synthesizing protein A
MTAVVHIDRWIDARATRCPTPLESLIRALHESDVGDVCGVISNDETARVDIPAWVHKAGHELVDVVDDTGVIRHIVRRTR